MCYLGIMALMDMLWEAISVFYEIGERFCTYKTGYSMYTVLSH